MSKQADYGYFSYWGKAKPAGEIGSRYHLLALHSLDVAACAEALVRRRRFSLLPLARALDWPLPLVERLVVFFIVLHDLGKFSRMFQGLVPDLSVQLVPTDMSIEAHRGVHRERHDTLGWLYWDQYLAANWPCGRLPDPSDAFWAFWIRTSVGHHGRPPNETAGSGFKRLRLDKYFLPEDRSAAAAFVADVAQWLLPEEIPEPGGRQYQALRLHSWRLAGIAVLADWLGSNQEYFRYHAEEEALESYWSRRAQPQAERIVRDAGLDLQPVQPWASAKSLFDYLDCPTPLQQHAESVVLGEGPQLFLLEDVTGAGKTEAALILTHRLMSAGWADGLYFGLPSMATANQMYRRVGSVYRHFYEPSAAPSLVLAHGARQLIKEFRQSVLQTGPAPSDLDYRTDERSATAQCNGWLADNRKKALLADIGVGTLDQALLAVLPARHQSLRLLGLARKVLIVDEVHSYDTYMMALLKNLLTAHAQQGGSAILLSATLPASLRADLAAAFQLGRGEVPEEVPGDSRYPLVTHVHARLTSHACATRPQLVRRVRVEFLHSEERVLEMIASEAKAGRCVCWIRNTVDDARHAYAALAQTLPEGSLTLFHSRYAMGDRLDIEDMTIARFGKESGPHERNGRVLVATQVVEQSLDLDFDVMVSDLAPIDMLIQRAGRLQRHARSEAGSLSMDGVERRPPPVFFLHGPAPSEQPAADWYAAALPKASYVYPHVGRLWLTQRALQAAGFIVSPGAPEDPGAVRNLVEAVYGDAAELVPEALTPAVNKQTGKDQAHGSLAKFNSLSMRQGYLHGSSPHWYEDVDVPTRLSDDNVVLYLACIDEESGMLRPLVDAPEFAWEHSSVRIAAGVLKGLSQEWEGRFGKEIADLRRCFRELDEPAIVLPVTMVGAHWEGWGVDDERSVKLLYDDLQGLVWRSGAS